MKICKTGKNYFKPSEKSENHYVFLLFRYSADVFLKNKKYTCNNDSALICRENQILKVEPHKKSNVKYDWISFYINEEEIKNIESLGVNFDSVFSIENSFGIYNIVKMIQCEEDSENYLNEEFSFHAMHLLLIMISRNNLENQKKTDGYLPYYKKLVKIREEIYSNPAYKWNVDEICLSLKISKTYFHRIYLSAFGVTCLQDVILSRIEMAEDMLINSDISINLIAEKCGYESDSYFMRQFKKCIGITPSDYRKKFSS